MAVNGTIISVMADTTQAENKIKSLGDLLDKIEKEAQIKPELNIDTKSIKQMQKYVKGTFSELNLDKVFSDISGTSLDKINQKIDAYISKFEILSQAVKPEDMSKLAAASDTEIFKIFRSMTANTNPTGKPLQSKLEELYKKYPNGIEGLGGSGKGGGFGASEEALNRIGDTLDRIDANVQGITESIRNGTGTLKAASQDAEEFAGDIEKAEKATDKLAQKQQDLRNAIRNETVNTDWDWTLQYLNGVDSKKKTSLSPKTEKSKSTPQKPKKQKGDSQLETSVSTPDAKPIKNVVKTEEELRNAAEGATNALREQNNEINNESGNQQRQPPESAIEETETPNIESAQEGIKAENELKNAVEEVNQALIEQNATNNDLSSSGATNNLQQLSESQKELGENARATTELLREQNQVLQETNEPSSTKKLGFKEAVQMASDAEGTQKFVYSIDEAEAKLKGIKKKYRGKKDEEAQLSPVDVQEVWNAINSLDQISWISSDTDADRITKILDQYTDWTDLYLGQDSNNIKIDAFSKIFEKISKYQEAFNKSNPLEQLRDLYNLNIEQRSSIMTPDNTVEGYTYALDRIKLILDVMDQYKAAIEDAQSKGKEITEADQKFLDNYDQTRNQWARANERAQRNLEPLQEQERLKEETRQRIAQEKEDEKQRRIFKQKLKREDRQARIDEDQQFEADFQNYDIKNIENMDLEEIDRQISQMEERKQKALELKGEFNQLEKTIKQNNSYGESKFDDETIALMRPTDQESQWLAGYEARMAKRKEYAEALKKRKSQLNKELSQKEEESTNIDTKDNGQKDVDQARSNAEKAQNAADKAKKAADESEEAVRRANDAQKKLNQSASKGTEKTSVTESANANQTAQDNANHIEESKEVLESNLSQLQSQVNKLQDRKKKLEKTKEQLTDTKKYDDAFFEIDAQESGKTAKKYRKDRTKEVTEELKRLEVDLEKKQTELQKVQEKINNINETEQQISDSQPQTENAKKKKSKKPKIIMSTQEQQQGAVDGQIQTQVENEKKNTDAAQQLGDQTQQTNDNLEKAKSLSDVEQQLLDSIFGSDGEKGEDNAGNSSGLQSESEAVLHLIDALKDIPSATQALSEFDGVNANISKNAQSAADAMQVEADAVSAMVQATQRTDGQNLEQPQTRSKSAIKPSAKPKATLAKESDEIKQVKEQIEQLQRAKDDAEQNLKSITLDDSTFDVGEKYQKRNAYSQVKQWADDLKKAQEEVNSLGKDADPQKAQEVLDNYDKMRIGFSKAFKIADNLDVGSSKNFAKPMEEFKELYQNLGEPSSDFKQVEERFAQASTQTAERAKAQFEQQKQQAEVLQARLEELQSKEKTTVSAPEKPKVTTEPKPSKPVENKPDLGGNQTGNGVQTEGDKAADAAAKMQELADAKKQVTEANQNLAQSAQNTTGALNGEGGAGANAGKALDPKPLQQEIDALKQVSEQQKKTIDEQKQAIDDLQKKQEEATNKKIENLQKENDAFTAQQQQDLQRYKEAELQTQMMLALQKQAAEEEAKVREEQEAKAAQKAKEQAEKAAQKAQTKADDKELAQAYGNYGKDFSAVLNAKSIQEFDTAVAHLTETERIFWDARLKNMGDSYAVNSNMYAQNDLPADYKKSTEAQTKGLKQRQMEIAAFTTSLISEAEKQQAAFEKMDTAYKTNTQNPTKGHLDFITSTKVDDKQARSYMSAVDGVTESLQKLQSVAESMKNGTFDFGDTNALRELLELRQTLDSQMSTLKVEDKGYKTAQSELEANANKTAEGLKKSLSGVADQIEGIQKKSKKLINPDQEYQGQLQASEQLLQVIKELIADINNNPLQFMDEGNVKGFRLLVDAMKEDVGDFQDRFDSQQGIQGRINTYFTSYKGAYTSFFREIKDSFKSQALGELQNEIDRTFQTFEDSITNLNRATGLNQSDFLNKNLNTNGGKATAGQIEQQQKVRNAIAESYRGLITDISDELTKVQDRMGNILGEGFLSQDYFKNFGEKFTAGLGDASKFKEFQNNAQGAVDAYSRLHDIQQDMANGNLDLTQLAPDELKKQIAEIVELFANLNTNYAEVVEKSKQFTFADEGDIERQRASITQFMKSNPGITADAKAKLQGYFDQLQQGISQADLTKLSDGWKQVADAEQAAGRTGATFMSELQTRFKSLGAYLLSFVSFYRVIGVFKDGINIIHELDDALTEMNKVSTESLASLKDYQKESFGVANDVGTTATQLQQSTADFVRLGESFQEAKESARVANELLTVSEFDNIQDATTALTAISAAYEDAANGLDKQAIIDKLNKIGDEYAISTDGLATALQDSASALTTANNDMDEAAALLAAGNTVTQDPSKTGKAMRTVALRLVGMKCA